MIIDNITFCLVNNAIRRPEHPALITRDETLDYRSLELRVQSFAGKLIADGVSAGDVVGLSLPESADQIAIIFALARLGAILLPMDVRWTAVERNAVSAAFASRFIICDAPIDVPEGISIIEVNENWRREATRATPITSWTTTADSPLMLSLSSGTTGVPKGPLVTHDLYMHRMYYEAMAVSSTQDDINMCALPMYFGAGRNITLQHLMMGATVVLFPPPYDAEDLVAAIEKHGVTTVFLVPTILRRLLKLEGREAPLLPGLRALISGAAPLFEEEARQIRKVLTPRLYVSYGTTEGGVLAYLAPQHDDSKLGSVGRPAFLCDVQIVDDDHRPVAQGEVGRVSFTTMAVPDGFYRDPKATAESFHEGRFLPGDLGRFDEDGFLYLVGRSKEVIIRGGVNIYPSDIEACLLSHDGVSDVAVCGWAVGDMGEEVAAFVVPKYPVTEESLIDHCRSLLARYKVPRRIFLLDTLPRNDGGKISKKALAGRLPAAAEGDLKPN